MERSPIKVPNENYEIAEKGNALDFDGDKLQAIADVYRNQGNEAFKKGDFLEAIYFYTEGIKVNCNEKELKAKLYNNRATAHFKLGNHCKSLTDAKAATELQPTYLKAIIRGATACSELKKFEEAVTWCDKGLAIDKDNQYLLELKIRSTKEVGVDSMKKKDHASPVPMNPFTRFGDVNKIVEFFHQNLKIAQERGDKTGEIYANGNLGEVFKNVNDFKTALGYYNRCLHIAKEVGDRSLEGRASDSLGYAYYSLGDFENAIHYYKQGLELTKEVGEKQGNGNTFGNLGNAYYILRDFENALNYYKLCLERFKEVGDRNAMGTAYGNIGKAYHSLSEYRNALHYHNLELEIIKELGDKLGKCKAYCNLGNAYYSLGDFKRALEFQMQHLECTRELKDKHGEGKAYGNLGNACQSLGDFQNALEYHNLALQIFKEVGDKHGEGKAHGDLGNVYYNLGDFNRAIDCHNLHLRLSEKVGDKHEKSKAYGNLGNAYSNLGDFEVAKNNYEQCLALAKEVGDRHGEGKAHGNLGNAFQSLGDFKKAIECHNLHLEICEKVGDRLGEGAAYGNLGNAHHRLGDFKGAIRDQKKHLQITQEVGDKRGEGKAYSCLGNAYHCLGDFKRAIDFHNLHFEITKEVQDKRGKGTAYCNLGNAHQKLGDFKKAIEYQNQHLEICKEVGDKHGVGIAYGNLGNSYQSLGHYEEAIHNHKLCLAITKAVGDKHGEGIAHGNLGNAYQGREDFKQAIKYQTLSLKIADELGDKHEKGKSYGNLGNAYQSLGDFRKAINFFSLQLKTAEEVEDKLLEAAAYYSLAYVFECLGQLQKAHEHYEASVKLYNDMRSLLKSNDEWKVNFRNEAQIAYTGLWRVLAKQKKVVEAFSAAERGRAQALADLMESSFCKRGIQQDIDDENLAVVRHLQSSTVFEALDHPDVNLWVVSKGKVYFKQNNPERIMLQIGATQTLESFVLDTCAKINELSEVRCEDRSLDALKESRLKVVEKGEQNIPKPLIKLDAYLSTLYNIIIQPVTDLLQGDELLIVPDGPLWLAPYAAFKDADSKYLCESFRIRLTPSLTSLRLISDCQEDPHSGALLVGDPWVAEVTNSQGKKLLEQLPCAKEEVEMIGQILKIAPITGRRATKREVLQRLTSVSLVHFAAHGCMETGEIALTPDPDRISTVPTKEDYILTIGDVLNAQLRTKLVVLSCCHSGQGEIKAEGVVGIARAFMGAGARSVVVSLWAIDDEATLEFMKCFYQHLAEEKPASESLNLAMKSLRESDKYNDVIYWAPFVLIGDDVTLNFSAKE